MSKGHPHLHPPPSKGEEIILRKFQIFYLENKQVPINKSRERMAGFQSPPKKFLTNEG
jgi:hypothetical protein